MGRGGRCMRQQDAEALGAALPRASLQVLELSDVDLFHAQSPHAALLRGLVGHATLHQLLLPRNSERDDAQRAAAGAELGALVAANTPALQQLDVSDCFLHDAGLAPLLAALPTNTHLRVLRCAGNACSATFARESLLPLVRANASLRELVAATHGDLRADDERICALREAQALVRSHPQP